MISFNSFKYGKEAVFDIWMMHSTEAGKMYWFLVYEESNLNSNYVESS